MGIGFLYECPQCDYSFERLEGIGLFFPQVCEEINQKAKDGELGREIQDFCKEYKDGSINASLVALCCDECNNLDTGYDLTMSIPNKRKERKEDSSSEVTYEEYAKYPHKCKKCGGRMHIVTQDETLVCPHCKIPLQNKGEPRWD